MKTYHTIIIGGGPAGMSAAIQCAKQEQKVLLLDCCEKIGKKILVTGNGKCNLTNLRQHSSCYRGNAPDAAGSIFDVFGLKETMELFHELGIYTKDKNGYVYPYHEQASGVREAFEAALFANHNLDIQTGIRVTDMIPSKDGFRIVAESSQDEPEKEKANRKKAAKPTKKKLMHFAGHSVIIATGGLAGKNLGCDGSGYEFAKKTGHQLIKPLPALTALKSGAPFLKKLSGVRNPARISLYTKEDGLLAEECGELQWTDYGISGVAVFQLSRFAAVALEDGKNPYVLLDFMPDISLKEVKILLLSMAEKCGYKNSRVFLDGFFPAKLTPVLLREAQIEEDFPVSAWKEEEICRMAGVIKGFSLKINGYMGFEKAQVTRGGVAMTEVTGELESRHLPGLFFAGEVLDVDGTCGGYNLQWAFSSGSVAGKAAFLRNQLC